MAQHREDHTLYHELLEQTRDADGICHRDLAVKKLAEILSKDTERIAEYATDRANKVADGFDAAHKPETEYGQMALDIETYLVLGDTDRVAIDRAMAVHTRQWLDIQASNHARVAAAWAAKDQHGRKLLDIQVEHKCSMWQAEQILRGDRLA